MKNEIENLQDQIDSLVNEIISLQTIVGSLCYILAEKDENIGIAIFKRISHDANTIEINHPELKEANSFTDYTRNNLMDILKIKRPKQTS